MITSCIIGLPAHYFLLLTLVSVHAHYSLFIPNKSEKEKANKRDLI